MRKNTNLIMAILILVFLLVISTSGNVFAANDFSISYVVDQMTGLYYNVLSLNNGKKFSDITSDIRFCFGDECDLILINDGGYFYYSAGGENFFVDGDESKIKIPNGIFNEGQNITLEYALNGEQRSSEIEILVNAGKPTQTTNVEIIGSVVGGKGQIEIKGAEFFELANIGWSSISITRKGNTNTSTSYVMLESDSNVPNVNGDATVISSNKIQVPLTGVYEVSLNGILNVSESYMLNMVDTSKFSATLRRNHEQYMLYYDRDVSELIDENGGKDFYIELLDMNGNALHDKVKSNKYFGGTQREQTFNNVELFKHEKIKVRFSGSNPDWLKTITLEVPQLDSVSDLVAKITAPGIVELYSKDGNPINKSELNKILGNSGNGNIDIKLCHSTGGVHVLDTVSYYKNNSLEFDKFTYGSALYTEEQLRSLSKTELQALLSDLKYMYDYWQTVKTNGDVQLYLQIAGNSVKVNITDPTCGNYRQFEAITGFSLSDFDKMMAVYQSLLLENVTKVADGGILEISSEEEYKDFYIEDGGIYYIIEQDDKGVTGQVPFICVPLFVTNLEQRIAFAGVLTGEEKDGKPLGQYVYYNTGIVTYGVDDLQANCFPIIGGSIYRIKNFGGRNLKVLFTKVDTENMIDGPELVEILDETASNLYISLQSEMPGYEAVTVGFILADDSSFFESLGSMLARFVRTLANGLEFLVQMSLQSINGGSSTVDIDKILFNHYPDTSIAFFSSNEGGDNPSKMIMMFRDGVNKWYSVFRGIAIAGYLVILLYIGVRILLRVGGSDQSKYKEMLVSWGVGVVLLLLFPYVIKYAIDLNNTLVAMIEDSKAGALGITDVNNSVDMSDFSLPVLSESEDYEAISSQMDQNPFSDSDNSYMATIARKAHSSRNLVDAVVYLIMVWQFIMIVIMYYKRVFTIAFLIAIFPFVALSYAIDKIGDGHAGAFGVWSKELMINIFIQSIHAVVYVFVIGATYTEGQYSGDWLLSIVGISFLFQGEEILKKIIGLGGGGTIKSLAQTAQRAAATVGAAKLVTSSVANNVIGANSHLGRTVSSYRQYKTERKIAKNMDILTPNGSSFNIHANNQLRTFNPNLIDDNEYNQLASDIQTLNNRENITDAEVLASALDNVIANRDNLDADIQNLMKGLNLSDSQLHELANLQASMISQLVDGDKSTAEKYSTLKETIDKELEAKLAIIFPGNFENREMLKRAMYFRLRDGDSDEKHKPRSTDRDEVREEFSKAKERRNNFFNPALSIENPFSNEVRPSELSARAISRRDNVLSTHFGKNMTNASEKEKKLAESIALVKEFSESNNRPGLGGQVNKYTAKQVMDAASYISEHQKDSKQNNNAVKTNLGINGDEIKAIVAEEVGKHYTGGTRTDKKDFRTDLRNGSGFSMETIGAGTNMQQQLAKKAAEYTWREAINIITAEDQNAGDRHCYDETLDVVSVKDVMRKERETYYDEETYISYIIGEREIRNNEEVMMVEDFAREQLDDLPDISIPTYQGLTKEEHEQYANDLREQLIEELGRTAMTTTGVVLGASIGAGLNIGLSDDKSALEEAFTGAAVGTVAGDYLAERSMGRVDKTKKLQIINPYTGEIEEFELRKEGITKDSDWIQIIDTKEVLRHDDPRLNIFSHNLELQYIKHKKEAMIAKEAERKRNLFNDALRR